MFFEWWDSPYINHFISADTVVPNLFNPQNINRYSYVRNNPLRYMDPSGHTVACSLYEDDCHDPDPAPSPSPSPNDGGNDPNDPTEEQDDPNPNGLPGPIITAPTATPSSGGVNNYDCFTLPYSCGGGTPSPTTEISTSNHPNWYHIAAGVGLAIVALAADALIIYTLPALIEVYEATVIVDAVATGMPLTTGLIYIHVEAITLIKDGINGK